MASQRLIRFVEGVARGLSDAEAARQAGYSESTASQPGRNLWSQPGARELYREAQRRHGRHVLLEPPPARRSKSVKTYFLRDESGHVKIGKTCNLQSRLHTLRHGTPEKLTLVCVMDGDREVEFHARFAEYCIKGDWFTETGRLAEFLEGGGRDLETNDRPVADESDAGAGL